MLKGWYEAYLYVSHYTIYKLPLFVGYQNFLYAVGCAKISFTLLGHNIRFESQIYLYGVILITYLYYHIVRSKYSRNSNLFNNMLLV